MREAREKFDVARAAVLDPRFWDAVEREIEATDPADLAEFLAAAADPVAPREGFFEELRERLRGVVRSRYGT